MVKLIYCVVLAVFWVLWHEKNPRVLEEKFAKLQSIWEKLVYIASFWASVAPSFEGIPLFLIARDWRAICKV